MSNYLVFPLGKGRNKCFKIYSKDMKIYYGEFYSELEVQHKISALEGVNI